MQEDSQKNVKIILLLIVVLLAGYFLYEKSFFVKKEENKPQEPIKKIITPQVTKISEDKLQKELPQSFLLTLPLNGKTKIIESYNLGYTQNPNIKQATTKFESSKTTKENYDFYEKWAKDNKWEIKNSSKQDNLMSLYGQKNQTILNITIIPKTLDNAKSEVNITYAEF